MRRRRADETLAARPRFFTHLVRVMNLDQQALQAATQTLDRLLRAEVEEQRAYMFHFSDGRISLELEWIDIQSIMQAVIASYVAHANKTTTGDAAGT